MEDARNSSFTKNDFLERAIYYSLRWDCSAIMGSRCFEQSRHGLHVPMHQNLVSFYSQMLDWTFKNAELLRKSLVDETIPLEANDEQHVFGIFDGGRINNAIALGELGYWPALPELREAMMHDLSFRLRENCVDAMGLMGKRSKEYARDIRRCVQDFDNTWFRFDAVKALGRLCDTDAVPLLRDLYEETRWKISQRSILEMLRSDKGLFLLLEQIVETLTKLDLDVAREVLAIGLSDPNPHVFHFTKTGAALSRLRYQAQLMKASGTAIIAFLPQDPRWSLEKPIIK